MKIQEFINNLFKHLSIYPVIICGWLIVVLNFLIFSNLHCINIRYGINSLAIIIASICNILLYLSIIIEIVCGIIGYKVKNEFILNNKFVKTFGTVGILVTFIVAPMGFAKLFCNSNTLIFYRMYYLG